MTTTPTTPVTSSVVELSPSYTIPLVLVGIATLRLQFTETDLDVYRSGQLIRRFPYSEWQNWRIFGEAVPILFYFKEVKSIHFLPIIFNPKTLKACLEKHCPYIP
jgi:hypothetical protein